MRWPSQKRSGADGNPANHDLRRVLEGRRNAGLCGKRKIEPEALEALTDRYDWPGNVREVANVLERFPLILGLARRRQLSLPFPESLVQLGEQLQGVVAEDLPSDGQRVLLNDFPAIDLLGQSLAQAVS